MRPSNLKSKSVIGPMLAMFCMAMPTCGAYAQQGVSGAMTAGTGSPAYLQFLGGAANPQIACALNAGSNCSILFTPMGTGGFNFQNGNGGNSVQILGTSVSPGDTLQYIPNGAGPAVFTASVGATFTGTGSGTSLTVTLVSGVIHPGSASTASITGTGVPSSTYIVSQTSGTVGRAGVYVTNNPTTSSGANITASSTTIDVTGTTSGTIAVGQSDSGIGIASGTALTALISGGGTGGVGPYTISPAQYAPSTTVTALGSTVTLETSNSALITLNPSLALTGTVSFNNNGIGATTQQKFQSTFNVSGIDADIGQQAAGIFNINANFENSTNFASAPPAMSVITNQLGTGYARDIIGLQVFANLTSTPTNVPSTWAATTAYGNGSMMYDASADLFQTFTGGTTGSIEPTLTSCKPSCTDGTVTWTYTGAYLYGIAGTVAAQVHGEINANQGGTAAATMGTGWGLLGGIIVGTNGTYTQAVTAQELDINVTPTGTAAPGSLVGLGIYTQAAGQGRFVDTALSIAGNTGDYRKNAIQFGSTLDPNAGVGLSVYDSRGNAQYGAGLIDCSQCGNFAGTQSQSGNDAPFILKSPYFDLLVTGDMRVGYGLIHVTSNGFTLDVPNYAVTGNSGFNGGTGWINGEEACDSLGNCGTITQSGGVPSGITVYTDTYIPGSAVPGATPVTWHAVSISSPGPTGGTTEGTPFTTVETYAQASNPTIGIGGVSATAVNIGNSGSTTTVGGSLGVTGTSTLASGNANYFTISGSSGSPAISVAGSGPNEFAQIKGLGTFGPVLSTGNGNVVMTTSASGTIGNYLTLTSEPVGTPFQVSTSDSTAHAGLQFLTFTQVQHNFAYAGTSGAANQNFGAYSYVTGTSADPSQYAINNIATNLALQTSGSIGTLGISQTDSAGFYGPANSLAVYEAEQGAPGTLAAWAGSAPYSTVGQMVQNGTGVYVLVAAGTSASSGGPTGTGSDIQDGTAYWRYNTTADQLWYHTTLGAQNNVSYNLGGTATDYRGFLFGGGVGVYLSCPGSAPNCATYVNEAVGAEIDAFMATGTSAERRAVLQIVGGSGGAQASYEDWGISIGSSKTAGQGLLNPLIFVGNDANSYGIDFWDQGTGGAQPMAGAIDMMRVNANGSGPSGGGFLMRWANGALTNPTGQFTGGVLQLGAATLSPSSTGLTMDVTLYGLSSSTPAIVSGGTNWTMNEYATDGYGNWGYVTSASGGAVMGLLVTTFGRQPAAHNGTVTWYPDSVASSQTAGGGTLPGSTFTVTEAWAQIASPVLTLGGTAALSLLGPTIGIGASSTTAINIGNSVSTTTIAGVLKGAAATFTANGSVATTMTSLGPTGAHATVQEWFTVTDTGGTVRYIPAY